nr:PKD domain-containing protein [bacterium]
ELSKDALLSITYDDSDVPQGRTEEEIVLVQNVNGVWVDVPNSRVENHNNVVEAPIRFLGLYALQLPQIDQRRFNAEPEASFSVSADPIAAMFAPVTEEDSEAEVEAADAAFDPEAVLPLVDGSVAPEEESVVPPAEDGASVGPLAGASVYERRIVAGPEDEANDIGPSEGAGNQAEAGAPGVIPSTDNDAQPSRPADKETAAKEPEVILTDDALALYDAANATDDDLTFYFDASKSADTDGRVVQYDWDFDSDGIFDLSTSRGPFAKHTFRHNGNYTVVLKVTDNGRYRRSGFDTEVVAVRDPGAEPAPMSANISSYPPQGMVPLTVRFAASIMGGSPPYKYNWRFSDGSQSELANPHTTYPQPSDHTVSFKVSDQKGAKLDGTLFVNACDCPPAGEARGHIALDITPDGDRGQAPLTSRFQLRTERASGPVVYRVSFGDEAPGVPPTETSAGAVTHTYTNPGFYIMEVLATDADLRTSKTFATVHVTPNAEPRDFTLGKLDAGGDPYSFGHDMYIKADYTQASPRTVAFYAQKTPRPVDEMSFQWDFGDGTYSTEGKPRKTFAEDGTYEVRLTASDGGQLYRHRIWLPVSRKDPMAAIQSPRVVEGTAPYGLDLNAIATRADGPLKYDWHIGNARRSDPGTHYNFSTPGEYKVNLTITDKYGDELRTTPVSVRVHANTVDYRQPLVVVERDPSGSGSRAIVLDYDAGSPMPLSSADVEGDISAVDISSNGEYVALVGADGLLVKQVSNARPAAVYLPAVGKVVDAVALDNGGAYASVTSAEGLRTYLVQQGAAPLLIGPGLALDASRGGTVVLVKRSAEVSKLADAALYRVNLRDGSVSEPSSVGKLFEGQLTSDGAELFFIGADSRIGIRDTGSAVTDYINAVTDKKHGLTISADGRALAYVNVKGAQKDVTFGQRMAGNDFELTSLTDQTGFFSDTFELGSNGQLLLAYGSRSELRKLLGGNKKKVDTEKAPSEGGVQPRPERVGVIRFDLSGDPQAWSIGSVDPRFVTDSSRKFATAGSV